MGMGLAVVLSSIWGRKSKTIPQMFPSCSQIVTEQLGDNAGNVVSASTAEVKKRYYNYVLRLAELKIQASVLQISEASLEEIKRKFEKGEEAFDSYNKVLADYTNHQSTKIQAEAGLFLAKSDLEELLSTKLENIK